MNNKEAEDIAYEIYQFFEDANNLSTLDASVLIANDASETFHRILDKHPKIKEKYFWWKTPTTRRGKIDEN